ncbi:hypothetical protein, partial [uncultured Thiodictyon sp.]|uniref:hypothetical protein n=1 Tax=uncultured Thiodictyon sp. TaxID=1846217 RepID=UPI0025EA979A
MIAERGRPWFISRLLRGARTWWVCLLPWLILWGALAGTGLLWSDWRHQQLAGLRANFHVQVAKVRASIESRLLANEQILRGIAGLFAANETVSREQFCDYVQSLRLKERY